LYLKEDKPIAEQTIRKGSWDDADWKGPLECLVQPPSQSRDSYGSDWVVQGLQTSEDRAHTASLGSLLHPLTILQGIIAEYVGLLH